MEAFGISSCATFVNQLLVHTHFSKEKKTTVHFSKIGFIFNIITQSVTFVVQWFVFQGENKNYI